MDEESLDNPDAQDIIDAAKQQEDDLQDTADDQEADQ